MKHYFIAVGTVLLACLLITAASAQPERMEKIQALKIAFITEKLDLQPSQAEKFWPVYNRYEDELRDTRLKFLQQYREHNRDRTEQEARKYIEDNLDFQEAIVDTRKKYKNEFLKVISAQQVAALYAAEREFKQMLIKRLQERRRRR